MNIRYEIQTGGDIRRHLDAQLTQKVYEMDLLGICCPKGHEQATTNFLQMQPDANVILPQVNACCEPFQKMVLDRIHPYRHNPDFNFLWE
ncbi:hypothetical protein [Larkinella soli]|uniref:hypothetical protein n=1 Tax=Larkinella soli TaxID=1770527 RepID=UPI000FFC509A|nr:hypothetical protein [Larkinella soli]